MFGYLWAELRFGPVRSAQKAAVRRRPDSRTWHKILTQETQKLGPPPLPYGENETQWLNAPFFCETADGEMHIFFVIVKYFVVPSEIDRTQWIPSR